MFKKNLKYTRNSIWEIYHPGTKRKKGGIWDTGYAREGNDLIIFMNIGLPGATGHDFDNQYDEESGIITWFGKPNTNSSQPTFKKLISGEYTPQIFARWDKKEFTYLGSGKIIDFQDGHITKDSNGKDAETIKIRFSPINSNNNTNSTLFTGELTHWPEDIKLISPSKFNTHFDAFKRYMLKESDIKFNSFSHPYIKEREDYKKDIRDKALNKLNFKDWKKTDIGSGKILKAVINAIEIQGNNLLNWQGRYGEDSKVHIAIIKTSETKDKISETENLFYNFYHSKTHDSIIFQNLIDYLGKKYALLAYLFYLKSDREYLPIATTYFDVSFNKLGSNFKTSGKASWENYIQYITLIKDVKYFIEDKLSHEIQLIDAHSFLWIIGSKEEEDFIKESEDNISVKFHKINTKSRKIKSRRKAGEVHTKTPVDFIENQKKKQLKGREAEEYVYNYEKEKLTTEGRPDLALKVKDRSLELGLGYDILSYNKEGEEKHIEVKSSNSNSFYLSKNELEVSAQDRQYWIYIVTINQQRTNYIIKAIESPQFNNESDFTLTPKEFLVTFSPCDDD